MIYNIHAKLQALDSDRVFVVRSKKLEQSNLHVNFHEKSKYSNLRVVILKFLSSLLKKSSIASSIAST